MFDNAKKLTHDLSGCRTVIANALHKAVEVFVSHSEETFHEVLSSGLWPIADAAALDRIIVFRVWARENNFAGEIYRWDKVEGGTTPLDRSLAVLPMTSAMKRWVSVVSDDICISLRRSEFAENEAAFLNPRGVKSILIVPVFTYGKLWGVVTFHDNTNERDFDEDCTALLRSAARLCANAIIREEKTRKVDEAFKALRQREEMIEILNRMALIFLSQNDRSFEEIMTEGVGQVVDLMGIDRCSLWRNFPAPDGLHTSQIYRWERTSGGTTRTHSAFADVAYAEYVPSWETILAENGTVNGPVRLMPEREADSLKMFGIVSAFVTPVYVNNAFWGFMLFEDLRTERYFDKDSTEILRSAAFLCANAVMRHEMESKLEAALLGAQKASRAKSDFLSNMSHEMRTPMNAIIGMTAIAKNAADDERKNYALNRLENASVHLLGIINDILDMSKIEANKLELAHIEFDVRDIVQKAVSFVHFRMEEKRHDFSVNVDSNVPFFCIGDDQRLTQILTNLLSNAVKFTPEGGQIHFGVSLEEKEDGICRLRFEVADSGIGIPPEQQEKIFRIFEQAENGTTRKFGGTGLGLAISKRIIELMDGAISVESEPDKGSRFMFTVKLSLSEKDARPHPGPCAEDGCGESLGRDGEFSGKKLLLAEDVEINREILIALLDGTGLAIDVAGNGKEAFDKVAADPDSYDLVLMDIRMPEMDGLEATRRIRGFEAEANPRRRTPIIAMTANVFKDDIEDCLAAGMDDHIGKPLDISTVFEKLRKYL